MNPVRAVDARDRSKGDRRKTRAARGRADYPSPPVSLGKGAVAAPKFPTQLANRRRAWVAICVVILLATHAVLAVHTLSVKTVTVDEVAHLPAGITYWQSGSFALYHQNPPLVKLLLALPALALRPSVPYHAHATRTHF